MPDVLIRDVPEPVVERLKERARAQGRSLQQELLLLLQEAARTPRTAAEVAASVRAKLAQAGRTFRDSTEDVREDRER